MITARGLTYDLNPYLIRFDKCNSLRRPKQEGVTKPITWVKAIDFWCGFYFCALRLKINGHWLTNNLKLKLIIELLCFCLCSLR